MGWLESEVQRCSSHSLSLPRGSTARARGGCSGVMAAAVGARAGVQAARARTAGAGGRIARGRERRPKAPAPSARRSAKRVAPACVAAGGEREQRYARPDARSIALDVVCSVLEEGEPLDVALAQHPELPLLKPQRRAFARRLATETFRSLRAVDRAVMRAGIKVPNGGRGRLANIIRLAAVQLLVLNTPEDAAVNETTELAKRSGFGDHKSLVFKACKLLAERKAELLLSLDDDEATDDLPEWLAAMLVEAYGSDTADALVESLKSRPCLDVTVRQGEDAGAWAAQLGGEVLSERTVRLPAGSGDVRKLPGFDDGAWWVQGAAAASAAPLALCGGAIKRCVDLCAAPGGKTLQLADAGVAVTAVDSSARRARILRRNLERMRIADDLVDVSVGDVRQWRPEGGHEEAVLLDAPCTATGTLRRHPNIAWQLQARDVKRLVALQREMLVAASEMVTEGGVLVYSTCSLLPAECEEQVEWFLQEHPSWRRQPVSTADAQQAGLVAADEALTAAGDLRYLPHHMGGQGGLDGFFAARLTLTP